MKKGALATGALALGSSGTAAAQDDGLDGDDDLADDQEWDKAIMPVSQFRPDAYFVISSPVLEWAPSVEEIRDNVWSEYNTRVIRYLNTDELVLWWQAHDAEVPEFDPDAGYVVDAEGDTGPNQTPQPEVFRMNAQYSPFGDSAYVTVNFTPVGEDEQESVLGTEDWWIDDGDDDDAVGLDDIDGDGNATDGNATGGAGVGGDDQTGDEDANDTGLF